MVTDHVGTPRMMADEAGALAWKAQLNVFGVAQNEMAQVGCPWRWPGQYEDEETGLYYNRFRYYDPEAGRYVSQDPIGLVGGLALYAYPHDPLTAFDPLGLAPCAKKPWIKRSEFQKLRRREASRSRTNSSLRWRRASSALMERSASRFWIPQWGAIPSNSRSRVARHGCSDT